MTVNKEQCFTHPKLTKDEVEALRNLSNGDATEYQQRLALAVIMKKLCRTWDVHFIPGHTDQSTFLAGRGFVGQQIHKYINLPVEQINDLKDQLEETPDEP